MHYLLAIDPGTHTGIAFRDGSGQLVTREISLKKETNRAGALYIALSDLYREINTACGEKYNRFPVYCEGQPAAHSKGWQSTMVLSEYRGAIQTFCHMFNLDYYTVNPSTLKRFATGNGRADKKQMQWIAQLDGFKGKTDNEADAFHIYRYAEHLIDKQNTQNWIK